jgi:hypothetical protein
MPAMMLWINGAFGAGKTTTAGLVTKLLEGAKVFDPEYVGYMLMPFVESPTGDFQDLPLWRHLVVQTMTGLDRRPFRRRLSATGTGRRRRAITRSVLTSVFHLSVAP